MHLFTVGKVRQTDRQTHAQTSKTTT